MTAWRALFRIAFRESWQAKGRTALICLLIGLPIAAATAVSTLVATQDVTATEDPDRFLGQAEAIVDWEGARVYQSPDGEGTVTSGARRRRPGDLADVLGGDRPSLEQSTYFGTAFWESSVDDWISVTTLDLTDPLANGVVSVISGRLPRAPDEVVVSTSWLKRHPGDRSGEIGAFVDSAVGTAPVRVVGVVRWTSYRFESDLTALADSPVVSLLAEGSEPSRRWFVGGDAVTWEQVTDLNELGYSVLSRAVLRNPPVLASERSLDDYPDGYVPDAVQWGGLILILVILEISLLAGPALAVSARRTVRTTALLSIAGGSAKQARGVMVARALVFGAWAAGAGVLVGLAAARLLQIVIARGWGVDFGPFDVRWWELAGFAAVGIVSAVAAGAMPAWRAARTDPVRALSGAWVLAEAGPAAASRWARLWAAPGWWGVLSLIAAVGLFALTPGSDRQLSLLASVVLVVCAMILLVPRGLKVLSGVTNRSGALARYALRDAQRHAGRTVPAIAAVAATVLGTVSLAVGAASSLATDRAAFDPVAADGYGLLRLDGAQEGLGVEDWAKVADVLTGTAPSISAIPRLSVQSSVELPIGDERNLPADYTDTAGVRSDIGSAYIAVPGTAEALGRLSSSQVRQAEAALADGRAVLIAPWNQTSEESVVQFLSFDTGGPMFETDASFLRAANGTSAVVLLPSARVLPEDVTVRQDAVWLKGELGQGQLLAVRRALLRDGLSASYETGRTDPPERSLNDLATVLVGAIAALVMLIGTITATLLALSDARDDLATLSAVGGTPRDRRRVVGATALVISGLGLVFGLVFSVLPAYAAARMASYRSWLPSSVATYDVPWALLSWLLLLPVITVAVAVLVAPRSPAWEERDGFAA